MDYEKEINELKRQLSNLQESFLQYKKNNNQVVERSDDAYNKVPQVDQNTQGVEENDGAIMDVADLADENSNAVEELAAIIDELDERVTALEEKEE